MLLTIAWRNVWRHKRRSAITLAASSFGLAVLITVFALGDGIHRQLIDNATRSSLGHLQVFARGYRDDPSPERAIDAPGEVRAALAAAAGVRHSMARIEASGLASSPEASVGVMILGVEPDREREATRIPNVLVEGSFLEDPSAPEIVIGARLAKRLRARLGDKIVLLAQAADGSLANELFRVRGIFKTGAEALDLGVAYVRLERARDFLVLADRATSFVVFAADDREVDRLQSELRGRLPPARYDVLTWKDLDPSLLQAIQLDDASIYILLLIVFFIVALGIVNTMLMSVYERTREFGVLLAMGMEPGEVVAMVSLESLSLGAVSLAAGSALGIALSLRFQHHGIDLSRWTQGISMANAFMEPVLYAQLRWQAVARSCAAVLIITGLAGLYPAIKAARLSPVESLRAS